MNDRLCYNGGMFEEKIFEICLRAAVGKVFATDEGLSSLGLIVSEHVDKLAFLEPGVRVLGKEVRATELRFTLAVGASVTKSPDEIIRGYKIGCFRIAREYQLLSSTHREHIFLPDYQIRGGG